MEFDNNETVLDVINDRLQTLNAKSFILRIAFVGEHRFENKKIFAEKYRALIEKINSSYCDVLISGAILLYDKLFFVICEGSENTIVRQINLVFNQFGPLLGKTKLLFIYHNVRERRFFTWTAVYAEPINQERKFNKTDTSANHVEYFQECMDKLKYLDEILNEKRNEIESNYKDFPDYDLINFILCSPYAMDLKDYAAMYLKLMDYSYCFENSWPAPYDFTPYLETTEMQKTYVELLSNIDDFLTEKESTDGEFNEEKSNFGDTVIDKTISEQVLRENEVLKTQLSLDESQLVREIKSFEKAIISREDSEVKKDEIGDDGNINLEKDNVLNKTNSEQVIKESSNLMKRVSLDENKLVKEIIFFEKTYINQENVEIKDKSDIHIQENKNTLTSQLSLDENKLVREIDFGIDYDKKRYSLDQNLINICGAYGGIDTDAVENLDTEESLDDDDEKVKGQNILLN